MKVYVVYVYYQNRFDGVYGVYKSDVKAQAAVDELEESGFRANIQMFHVKQS